MITLPVQLQKNLAVTSLCNEAAFAEESKENLSKVTTTKYLKSIHSYAVMKFLSLTLCLLIAFISVNAQDIIVTKDGRKIEAKVLEIELELVKYKNFDNQEGVSISMKKIDIASIIYQNGGVEVFRQQTPTQAPAPRQAPVQTQTPAPTPTPEPPKVYSKELKLAFDEIGQNDKMMLEFFDYNNYMKYYHDFASACKRRNAGVGLLVTGLVVSGVGVGLLIPGLSFDSYYNVNQSRYDSYHAMLITGIVLLGVGQVLTIVSIPLMASAGARKKAIKNNFAIENFGSAGYTYQPTLNFNCTGNGFELSLNF